MTERGDILKLMIRDAEASGLYRVQLLEAHLLDVQRLHSKETRWQSKDFAEKSWSSREDMVEYYGEEDMPPEPEITTFDVCAECSRIEYIASDYNYVGDQSAWPCATARTWGAK